MFYEVINLERKEDERGWLVEMTKRDLKQVIVASMKPGAIRGNHYHKIRTDFLFLTGSAKVFLEDVNTGKKTVIHTDTPKLIIIYPYTQHKIISNEDLYFVEGYDKEYDPTDDFRKERDNSR